MAITPNTLSDGTRKKNYSQQFSATPSDTYTWSLSAGSLPEGLGLSSSGLLEGIIIDVAGAYSFTIKATGASTGDQTQALALTVNEKTSNTFSTWSSGATPVTWNNF